MVAISHIPTSELAFENGNHKFLISKMIFDGVFNQVDGIFLHCSRMHLGAVLGPRNFFLWTRISYAHYPIYRIFLRHWKTYTDFINILRYDDVVY